MSIVLDDNKLQEICNDSKYLHTRYNELLEKYDQQYIAIKNQQVCRNAKTLDKWKNLLQKENIQLGTILVEFISNKQNYI